MNDRQIEEMLRKSWSPKPPDRLRNRVLSQAVKPARRISTWKLAFASLGVAVVIFTSVSDHFRSNRIASMTGGRTKMEQRSLSNLENRYDSLQAWLTQGDEKGGNSL